ncbi:MAG TPA: BatA domain-containing protein [Longimicrobiales bacterium]|nr:BatA domain-containing protein [Longimicrobiales bacterium]
MGLLNPLLLLIAAAAAIPLLLHLLQRHQGPRVVFPALRYLRRAEKESARRIRLRQILLMLLRMIAVLLIACAAARPFWRAGGVGHAPTAVVIILDNSMSSAVVEGDTRVLDELKARALAVLDDAGPDDLFWLLRAGQPGEPALAGDAQATTLRVRETEPTAAAADLGAAIVHARALLATAAGGRAQEIHLLTDLQATSFPSAARADTVRAALLIWHPASEPPANRAVTAVEVGGGLSPIAAQRTSVAATVSGAGSEAVNVRLTVDDRLAAAATARPGETAVLALPPRAVGPLSGRVDIDADALHADDRRYFATRVLPPPAVALAGDADFVEQALAVLTEAGRVRRATVPQSDVAILPAATGIEARGARGATVILPPSSAAELSAVNRRLASAGIPWRYGIPVSGEARFAGGSTDALVRALESARLRLVFPLTADGAGARDSVLLRLSDGSPWAVRGERRVGGSYVLLGSPLSAEASTIPTSAAMLPLLDRVTSVWTMSMPPRTAVEPGEEIAVADGATAVVQPDGSRADITGDAVYRLGAAPGIYTVVRGDSVLAAYAVNPPASESDLTRLDERALPARVGADNVHVFSSAAAWRRAVYRERLGRELWRPLLVALLAVLLIETFIAAAGRTRRAAQPGTAQTEAGPD